LKAKAGKCLPGGSGCGLKEKAGKCLPGGSGCGLKAKADAPILRTRAAANDITNTNFFKDTETPPFL
jgi:hypothetical protein